MDLLDPTLDVVFKLLLLRERLLLVDMLQGVLARPIGTPTVLNPGILGQQVHDKQVTLDLRVRLADGSRADLEMQRRTPANLASRLVYYGSRDYADQLVRGNDYSQLAGTSVIAWLVRPLFRKPRRLHSVFELRERHTSTRLSEHLSFHLLQLSHRNALSSAPTTRYHAQVARWARFFSARSHAELDQLASETRIMSLAKHTLEQLSQDPEACDLAREREDAIKLYKDELAVTRARAEISGLRKGRKEGRDQGRKEGRDQGRKEGRVQILLEQLSLRFGRLSSAARTHVQAASAEQLDAWARRVLTARSLDEVLSR